MSRTHKKKNIDEKLTTLQRTAVAEARKGHYGKLLDCLWACSRAIMTCRMASRMGVKVWAKGMLIHYSEVKSFLMGQIMHGEVRATAEKICDKIEGAKHG